MNNWQQFEHRVNTRIITSNELHQDFSDPECLRLQLSTKLKKKPVDIGSLAYFIRGKNKHISDDRGTPVVVGSFIESRRELVIRLLHSFVGLRERSILTHFVHAEYFVVWLNENGYRELFSSLADAQRAYRDYTGYLSYQIHHQKMKPVTASGYQAAAARCMELRYPEHSHYIIAGAPRIISELGSAAANTNHVDLYRDACLAIARQCGDFVLKNKPYPCVVGIRGYETVLFPSYHGAVGPFKESPLSYNAAERRIATVEEYIAARDRRSAKPKIIGNVASSLARTRANFLAANEDERYWHRYYLASLAVKAYAAIFLLITGATPTEFAQFSLADALKIEDSPIKKELSAVKFRAGGRRTNYNIGRNTGLPLLKAYLKLRKWVLNGASHERLFFTTYEPNKSKISNKSYPDLQVTQCISKLHTSISGVFLDPKVPRLSARKMRKHKSNGMHSARISPSAVAASLNHSVIVNLSTYTEATAEQQQSEFGQFWQSVRHAAAVVRERSEKAKGEVTSIAAGHCDGFNQPKPICGSVAITVEPNCQTQYGCLYCEHYICHSDEDDLHKLLSLQYVINAVRKAAPDSAHAEALYKELSIRIEFILSALGERSELVKNAIERVKAQVFEYGELTAFWDARLSRYEKMGVVL